jgi:hypothetical protein
MMTLRLTSVLVCLMLAAAAAFPQAQISSGDVKGTIYDASGAVVPNASITATNQEKNISRPARSGSGGEYALLALPPGVYTIRAEAAGFSRQIRKDAQLTVGETLRMDFHLQPGEINTELVVTTQAPPIEVDRIQQSATIEGKRIGNLPINRRNYLDFAMLTPGVTESNDMVDNTDFRVAQAPQSGLSFAGSNGRRNFVSVDGAEAQLNTGGVRATVTQESVQEFQINRANFSAEFGQSTGGVVNIVTKSGSNEFHGNAFAFVRNKHFQARNYFDQEKAPFTRVQDGFTLGGPVKKNKTFFFTGFERLDRNEASRVPLLLDPGIFTQFQPLHAQMFSLVSSLPASPQTAAIAPLAAQLKAGLTTASYPATLNLFRSNSGTFPFGEGFTTFLGKIDHHFSDRDHLFFRDNITDDFNQNAQSGALIAFNRGRNLDTWDNSAVLGYTHVFRANLVNEFRTQFGYNKIHVIPLDPLGPEINITGYGFFGREIFLPSKMIERHYQWQDNLSWTRGRHTFKFGGDINPVQDTAVSQTFMGGRFSFGEAVPLANIILASVPGAAGVATLQAVNALLTSPAAPAALQQTTALSISGVGTMQLSRALATPITALQAFNLGLPTYYQQGFGDPNLTTWAKRFGFYVQDTWKVRPNFTLNAGLRYELDGNKPYIPQVDTNNFGPRFGFSWDPFNSGKTAIRGGYGIYYGTIDGQVADVAKTLDGTQIAQTFVPLTGLTGLVIPGTTTPVTSAVIYQTLLKQGVIGSRQITAQDLAQFGIRPGPNAPLSVVFGIDPNFVNPYAQQASFGIDRQVGGFALSANYVFNRTAKIVRILDRNLVKSNAATADPRLPAYTFKQPLLNQLNIFESSANVFYHALVASLNKRFARHVMLDANYTFSKAIDEVTDFNTDFQPNDQTNSRADRALSSFDQRHRFVVSAVLESPFSGGQGPWRRVLANFTVAPVVVASSGRPFNVLLGYDNVGDRHPTTHRPRGAGRNIGHGPDFFTTDLRVTRRFAVPRHERMRIELIGEAFNLLNRTNFRTINNMVGCIGAATGPFSAPDATGCTAGGVENLPRPLVGRRLFPTEPLAFTSTFDPRQFQFGLRLTF